MENFPSLYLPRVREILDFLGDWSCGERTELVQEIGKRLCVGGYLGLWEDRWGVWRGDMRVLGWVRLKLKGEGDETSRPV